MLTFKQWRERQKQQQQKQKQPQKVTVAELREQVKQRVSN